MPASDPAIAAGPLHRAIYVSESLIGGPVDHWAAEVEDILLRSRRHNLRTSITGALLLTERCFVQVLEGSVQAIDEVLTRIYADPRHHILRIEEGPAPERQFGEWSMAYLGAHAGEETILTPTRHFAEGEQPAAPVMSMMCYLLESAGAR
ncbi:BLUF domain-containing protein [Roseomonas sp. SSH11]|uniref:BLUF domain-containing protein n=1 Tax=Pararoseomonas baculiformis TaxID=2820812 RepID=A0ABS4AB58_9PROT|nr:BLUF domain-containing protein [Pararoseomonas baculiformis]MBP0444246.1 BLUF domain-containing protein [Pararoseomonas baculiformis]